MRHILLAATALAMLGGVAYAQDSISGSNSTTNVNTSSGSVSQSTSNPRVNVIGNPIGNGASSSYSGAKSSSNSHSNSRSASVGNASNINISNYAGVDPSGSTDPSSAGKSEQYIGYGGGYTVRNVPEVIPPSVVGGNPCAVGASGGLAVAGFGIAGGGTWADKACERRQQAALLYNMGEQKIALELMCQDDNIRSAMKVGGKPCTADVAAAIAPAPLAQAPVQAPIAQAPAARVMPVASAAPPKPARPEWCYTASRSEQRAHAVCDLKS
jgi:hypothetical protein